jgi:hypothetical protein
LSTSIRPKIKVRPLAIMNTIMPIARPATVSVTQVGKLPTSGNMSKVSTGTRSSGNTSTLTLASGDSCGAGCEMLVMVSPY